MSISIQKNISSFLIALIRFLFHAFSFMLSAMQLHVKCFQTRSCPKQDKKEQSKDIKSVKSNTSYGFEYEKTASVNCLLKCS